MLRSTVVRHAMPLALLLGIASLDLALGSDQVVFGLLALSPLLAAALLGRRWVVVYGAAALAGGVLLGVYDHQYGSPTLVAQSVRLAGIVLASGLALLAATVRLRSETEVSRLRVESATGRAATEHAARLAGLVEVARLLGSADSADDVVRVLRAHGLPLLGASGAGLLVVDEGRAAGRPGDPAPTRVTALSTYDLRAEVQHAIGHDLAEWGPVLVRGSARYLDDVEQAADLWSRARPWYERTGTRASCLVPVTVSGLSCALWVGWAQRGPLPAPLRELVEALAAQCAQTLGRVRARDREREAGEAVLRLAETLQRSLLTPPPRVPGLEMAVRYLPAARHAQVGGDWYDAFPLPSGRVALVIGDVAGHDRSAAATMAQVRGVVRGIAQGRPGPPSTVLTALDRAMGELAIDTLVTAVVADLAPPDPECPGGCPVVLRWSNAGHPPPLLVPATGAVRLLESRPDVLLGLGDGVRQDHEVTLRPGDLVLLYTDGLVERRGAPLDEGLDWLCGAAGELQGSGPEELCDALLGALSGRVADDVALLALRVSAGAAPAAG